MDNDVMDTHTDADTQITIEWHKSEVTTYRVTLDLEDFSQLVMLGEDGAEALAALRRGESATEYMDADLLTDFEESENEQNYECNDRTIDNVTEVSDDD